MDIDHEGLRSAMPNKSEPIKIEELLNLDDFQSLQDGFAQITGLSVVLCKTNGELLTRPSLGSPLCRQVHGRSTGPNGCRDQIVAAARSITSDYHIRTSECFCGSTIFAVPILVEAEYLAAMVVCGNPEKTTLLEPAFTLLISQVTTLIKLSVRDYQLRQRLNELTILHNLTSLLAGRADLDQILTITAEQVVRATEGKGCSIRIYNPDTRELHVRAVANLSAEYLRKGPLKLERSPIDQTALAGEPVLIADMHSDPRVIYKKEARREGIRSGLAVGMIYRGQAVGVIHLYCSEPRSYGRFEIECLKAIASQAASAIINAQLYQEALEAERMQRQLTMAAEVQGRMLPKRSPNIPNIEIGSIFEPSYRVGGDFYDFQPFPDGKLGIVIADVAGKGIPASLQMASLRATIRAYIDYTSDLDTLVKQVDRAFRRDSLTGEFATMILGIIDPVAATFTYANAGHNPALLVRNHLVEQLNTSGPALAIFDDPKFPLQTLRLQPSDQIVLYTDGIVDAMNFDQQSFSLDRLIASIHRYADLSASKMAENILWDVRRFIGLATQSDDMTLMVIQYSPQNPR